MKTRLIVIKFDLEGIHNWPNAPEQYKILSNDHGHIFHFEFRIRVQDYDREVEFLDLRRRVIDEIRDKYGSPANFGGSSCERIAESLVSKLESLKDLKVMVASVSEDNFVGAEIVFS